MIKHDYKPQNNKRLFGPTLLSRLPAWVTHPFMIIFMATLIMLLAIFLSDDTQNPNTLNPDVQPLTPIQPQKTSTYDKGEIPLVSTSTGTNEDTADKTVEDSNYSAPIEIPLEISSSSTNETILKPFDTLSQWQSEMVKKGDNLSLIFKRIGLSPQVVHKIITLDENTKKLKNLRPGEIIHYQLDDKKQLTNLKYVINLQNTLYISQNSSSNNDYTSQIINKSIELRTAYVSGTITDSLYMSGKRAGLTDTLVVNLANIFAWDIDFILDIRKGDAFSLLYEEQYLDGEKIGDGNILAAEFINRGEVYRAIRYTDSNENTSYYSDEGRSMRKAFLRAPVNFKYISDSFNPKRFHPVQKRIKPHRGIDYAAPVGTPIRAAGDGKVIASGYNRFNGKYVFIQHGNNIVTKYLHLSKRLVSRGKRVKQGQTIGKLGRTGMVTGPHLHYEFVVNGVHRNPRTVKLPKAEPISKSEKSNFTLVAKSIVNQLESRKLIQSAPQVAK